MNALHSMQMCLSCRKENFSLVPYVLTQYYAEHAIVAVCEAFLRAQTMSKTIRKPEHHASAYIQNSSENNYGLVWKVEGYDDRYPDDGDLDLFERVGVYGTLKRNSLHHNYMGACE